MRNNDIKVKGWWILQTAQKIVNELHPNIDFRNVRPFQTFKDVQRRQTHSAQKQSEEFGVLVQQFHHYLRRSASLKEKETGFLGPRGLETSGEKTIWCRITRRGQHKWQCTVQLTLFADGMQRVRAFCYF